MVTVGTYRRSFGGRRRGEVGFRELCRRNVARVRRPEGLSSVELLVAISVIALLIAVLIPALVSVRSRAGMVVCQSRLKQWGLLLKLYTDDHDGRFFDGWLSPKALTVQNYWQWIHPLWPYYEESLELLMCPMATRVSQNWVEHDAFAAWVQPSRWGNMPDNTGSRQGYIAGSYGINSWVYNVAKETTYSSRYWKSAQTLTGGAGIPVLLDSAWLQAWPFYYDDPPRYPGDFAFATGSSTWRDARWGTEIKGFCIDRHNGFVNGLFMDWSVREVGLKELWTLKWHKEFNRAGPWTTAGGARAELWPMWMRQLRDY